MKNIDIFQIKKCVLAFMKEIILQKTTITKEAIYDEEYRERQM